LPPPSRRSSGSAKNPPRKRWRNRVQALAKNRFLAKEAPRLPLDECTVADCQCEYKHHDDRRDEEDRREEPISVPRYEGEQRRRAREDRRKSIR
jgi:hypothetical protein